jgi:hypothetical protein
MICGVGVFRRPYLAAEIGIPATARSECKEDAPNLLDFLAQLVHYDAKVLCLLGAHDHFDGLPAVLRLDYVEAIT